MQTMAVTLKDALAKARSDIKGRLDGTYQHAGVEWMLKRELQDEHVKGGILADDMGLGKTMQTISLMRGNPMTTLIVTIVGTVNQWKDALVDFGGYRPVILNPSFVGILPNDIDVVVTPYSTFQKNIPPKCLYGVEWGRVVLDEGHVIRNKNTKLFKEISRLQCNSRWVLSGTPVQNSEKDIYNLAEWIGMSSGFSIDDIVSRILLRRTQEEQASKNPRLALPPLKTKVVKLDFADAREESFYNAIEEHFSEKMSRRGNDAMTFLTKCRQACTNPLLYANHSEVKTTRRTKKRKNVCANEMMQWDEALSGTKSSFLVNDILAHHKKSKCLVFCIWTEEMRLLSNDLKKKGVASLIYDGGLSRDNKEAVLYNFKNTSIPVLILQINCGSAGLNLQCASRVYITSPNWNPCIELQAIGRAYRKGQTECVTCVRLLMKNTVEERCMEIQNAKMEVIRSTMLDDSFANRLGMIKKMEEINIGDIFKVQMAKKQKVGGKREGDVECEDAHAGEIQSVQTPQQTQPMQQEDDRVIMNTHACAQSTSCEEDEFMVEIAKCVGGDADVVGEALSMIQAPSLPDFLSSPNFDFDDFLSECMQFSGESNGI